MLTYQGHSSAIQVSTLSGADLVSNLDYIVDVILLTAGSRGRIRAVAIAMTDARPQLPRRPPLRAMTSATDAQG